MLTMLTELCQELRNWFEKEKYFGAFEIRDGTITAAGNSNLYNAPSFLNGQYFRICGSWWNDGIRQWPDDEMTDEVFSGSIWLLAIPEPVIKLAQEIQAWRDKYEAVDSPAMSPYSSESFGGYSYSKSGTGSASGGGTTCGSWKTAFASRLNAWRKI